jgi:hypothetical protein
LFKESGNFRILNVALDSFRKDMKAQLKKGAAVLSATAAVSLLQALPASAYTITGSGITFFKDAANELFTVEFDGSVDGNPDPNLTSKANVELVSFDGSKATFNFQLFNTTAAPLGSRVSLLGFNSDPDVSSATVSGGYDSVGSGNTPNIGQREICFKSGGGANNCAGGAGSGPLTGQNISFQAMLNFATEQENFELDGWFVRYQSITGSADGSSGAGTGTPIPTPALLPGLIGMGIAAFRKRKGEVDVSAEEVAVKV